MISYDVSTSSLREDQHLKLFPMANWRKWHEKSAEPKLSFVHAVYVSFSVLQSREAFRKKYARLLLFTHFRHFLIVHQTVRASGDQTYCGVSPSSMSRWFPSDFHRICPNWFHPSIDGSSCHSCKEFMVVHFILLRHRRWICWDCRLKDCLTAWIMVELYQLDN